MYSLSIGIAIASSVLYHVFQKAIAPGVHPIISVLVTYVTAFVLSLPLFALFPLDETLSDAFGSVNWASYALAVAIVGLEVGFLLAYRAGWNINLVGIAANVAAALILLPLGALLFDEKLSLINMLGVLVCVAGLVMVNARSS